jgi:DNA-binding beta-propeller fold protein YncE
MRVLTALACAAAAASAAPLYVLDTTWPAGIAGINATSITAVAVVNNSGTKEIHVAQRNPKVPFVLVFDSDKGALLRTWGANLTSPHGLYGQGDRIWVADIGEATVKEYDLSGNLLAIAGTPHHPGGGVDPPQFSAPADIAITGAGLWLTSDGDGGSNSRVLDLIPPAAAGQPFTVSYGVGGNGTAPGQFQSPHSIAYQAATKTFWVANRGDVRLDAFDAETGVLVGSWDGASCFSGIPWGVRLDEVRGRMIVADGQLGNVYVLALQPAHASLRGGKGKGGKGAEGPAAFPPCKLLQTITVGVAQKPHEVAVDAETGSFYLAGVGTPSVAQRYNLA